MTRSEAYKLRALIEQAAASLPDEDALEGIPLFPAWVVGKKYTEQTDRVAYDGKLYRCVQSHTSQSDWTPDIVPALWTEVSADEWPEWRQPEGAHNAYKIGAKASYDGKHWICTADNNIYAPGVYGWDLVE